LAANKGVKTGGTPAGAKPFISPACDENGDGPGVRLR
jgi:hypothetical protein